MRAWRLAAALATLILPASALTASASPDAFQAARTTPSWQGCVYEDGFAPYPIELTARGEDVFVTYAGLCGGRHNRSVKPDGADAIEVIVFGLGRCVDRLGVTYSLRADELRIDYQGSNGAIFAILHPATSGPAPTCNQPKAIS